MQEQEELIKFIQWLPENVEEFKGKTPEEVANALNELSKSEEGNNVIKQWMAAFKKASQMFRKGGKMESFVSKFQGGNTIKEVNPLPTDRRYHYTQFTEGRNGWTQTDIYDGDGFYKGDVQFTREISPDKRDTMYYFYNDGSHGAKAREIYERLVRMANTVGTDKESADALYKERIRLRNKR